MADLVDLDDRRLAEQLRRLAASISALVWPVIRRLPVEPHATDLITRLIDLELAAEELASEPRFLAIRGR